MSAGFQGQAGGAGIGLFKRFAEFMPQPAPQSRMYILPPLRLVQ
jgi:hypothetical protein